jgi:hypothetical protein
MLKRIILILVVAFAWQGSIKTAAAQHERSYEFNGIHFATSIERFMGIDLVDFEGPGNSHAKARFLLNGDEPVPTSVARFGFDVFIRRFSLGLAGGVTSDGFGLLNPRVGYLFGLTPELGIWFRGGAFYTRGFGAEYFGLDAEVLFSWFPYPILCFHLGPTLDLAFAKDPHPNYVSFGLPEFGMTAFF